MINKRLTAVAELVPKGKVVLDVGTDHALLPIYLIQNSICPKVLASDISANAIKNAKANITKYGAKNIKLYVSDGLKDVPEKYDVIILSGMGASTILEILNEDNLPETIIISSNNHLELIRKAMNKKDYKIIDEKIVYERNKYYDIILYKKGKEKLRHAEIAYGKSADLEYLNHLYKVEKKIHSVAPLKKKLKMRPYMHELKKTIKNLQVK